jgi:hypothetical protein
VKLVGARTTKKFIKKKKHDRMASWCINRIESSEQGKSPPYGWILSSVCSAPLGHGDRAPCPYVGASSELKRLFNLTQDPSREALNVIL